MALITASIEKKCKSNVAGVSSVWLFPYVRYSQKDIVIVDNTLTSYPYTVIYQLNPIGDVTSTINQSENEGGKFYTSNVSFKLALGEDLTNLTKILNQEFGLIIKDRNGLYMCIGGVKGMECTGVAYTTGSGKNEFNGYTLSFEGREVNSSLFVDDLEGAGFLSADFNYRITENGGFRILENNELRII